MKKGYIPERERKLELEKDNYFVLRVSGSIGAGDIIAIKYSFVDQLFLVRYEQVKSTSKKVFYFNKQSRSELKRLMEIEEKYKIPCFFSIKFKNNNWLIIEVDKLNGKPIRIMK